MNKFHFTHFYDSSKGVLAEKFVLAMVMFLFIAIPRVQSQSVGLVLSGGGAKGIAHIGVIQALEDNDIPINYVTGTSMGAIVGGLYAAGYTPAEMMKLIRSKDFANWSTGVVNESLVYYFDKASPTPTFFNLNFSLNDSSKITTSIVPTSLINPLPMNFGFMELFAGLSAQCHENFNDLFVPFRCITSDVYNKRKYVCRSGSLGDAIRASMSFPIVFKPIYMNGVPMFDGGIYDNFPIDVMRHDFAPDFTLGIDVSSASSKTDVNSLVDQIETMIIQNSNVVFPDSTGIKMTLDLHEFGLLDFNKADAIYKVGYDYAMSMMDSVKARIHNRIPAQSRTLQRNIFKSKTPYVLFDSVAVTGAKTRHQDEYIEHLFERGARDTFNLQEAKIAYYRATSSEKLKDLVPTSAYNDSSRRFLLKMKATVKDNFSLGVGGFLSSSTNSMIFLSANYRTLSFNSFEASLRGWIGQSYYATQLLSKFALQTHVPSYAALQFVASKQKFYQNDMLFYSDELPSFIINYDTYLRLCYGMAMGRKAKLELGAGFGHLSDRFYQTNVVDFTASKQDHADYNIGQVRGSFERDTHNHSMYPTAGSQLRLTAIGAFGDYTFTPAAASASAIVAERHDISWIQAELSMDKYFHPHPKLAIGAKFDVIASTRKLMDNYTASIVQAPAFSPTPATQNYFNPDFRSNSFIAAGILPIFKPIDNLQLRTEFYAFAPFRQIKEGTNHRAFYGNWFSHLSYMGEAAAIYTFSFASLSIYGNYLSYPSHNWNFGISFGLLFTAPKYLR